MSENIALIIPKLYGGGAERIVANLTKKLSKDNKVYIITYKDSDKKYEYKGTHLNLDIDESRGIIGKFFNTIKRIKKVKEIKEQYNIDRCISFLDNPNIINIMTKNREKVVISVRNNKSAEIKLGHQYFQKMLIKHFYNKADKIIALSKGVENDLIENFNVNNEKIDVIYNPIDYEEIRLKANEEIEDEYKNIFEKETIITSGRLTDQKGQWHLIKAFKEVLKKRPDLNLVILGEGELFKKLNELIKFLGIEKNVYLLGNKKNPFKYIKNSKMFVFPSNFEGFGNVILEAAALNIPVISTDCKFGPREILSPSELDIKVKNLYQVEYGLLVPVSENEFTISNDLDDAEYALDIGIRKLLDDKKLYKNYVQKSDELVKKFDIKTISEKWLDI